ncbi:DNA repair protein rad10 [Drepanopeziza brunnea f. sp. 'multigermtubi' MB_m1]|uniref:DNA repair protein rad10 n=1 Tax=Marssonina brunnea f. sp. multigermtubi (strain MB_m1) TaxID=1072389 RepID=K1WUA6_MARBU|nr:DNA repair protein rad10 [Drepanopeziza brunnea f. sp. 'multigermtubi' MB_m1]EKD16037.1 DNA repair protein rad10 [Drepanopeziza brunnea f. sp. 'multigermtubi' MB_m1]
MWSPEGGEAHEAERLNNHNNIINTKAMDDEDEFGADADFLAALAASSDAPAPPRVQQPTPQRITQPTPQRLDRAPPPTTSTGPKVVQPTPQAIASHTTGSSILVSPRQKGNPILTNLRSFPWEFSDVPADYVLGLTTCALFLSLKYHRLHPEYIYNRIKGLQGKYNLRVVLTMVDIQNHEESLKELSKTSLVNNVTVMLCWSAAEAARYLELYKSYEHANPSAIRGTESKGYAEKMVDFVTVPRSINKTDAVSIVSAFGSIKGAINARPEEVAVVGGWGEKKVRRWCAVVDEPFRARKATKRVAGVIPLRESLPSMGESGDVRPKMSKELSTSDIGNQRKPEAPKPPESEQFQMWDPDDDDEDALLAAAIEEEQRAEADKSRERARKDDELSGGVAAALAKLRDNQ